jgi:hypothetical protein
VKCDSGVVAQVAAGLAVQHEVGEGSRRSHGRDCRSVRRSTPSTPATCTSVDRTIPVTRPGCPIIRMKARADDRGSHE